LIGEIYLRLGKIDKARQWFSKLLENRKFQDSKYFKMARDRLSLLRGAKK
jgi:dsRNA-specific ribonuclease